MRKKDKRSSKSVFSSAPWRRN